MLTNVNSYDVWERIATFVVKAELYVTKILQKHIDSCSHIIAYSGGSEVGMGVSYVQRFRERLQEKG